MDGAEENFEILSIEDRLVHKSWKARLSAYTSLISTFRKSVSENDPVFRAYVNNPAGVKEWVRDSNAVSQEKGVEVACALIEFGGKATARTRSEVIPSIIEKCLGSARAGTKSKALELCLLYVEVEEDQGEGVIDDVIVGLSAKAPKVVAGSVSVLREIVRLFGPKTISLKPILAVLPKIFNHADNNVRTEGTLLAIALHSYLGPALTSSLSDLKPVQVKELGEKFVETDAKGEGFGATKQSRFTKSQQRAREIKVAEVALSGGVEEEEVEEAAAPVDPFEFVEPATILDALPEDFYTHLSSTKWKDRKDLALDPLLSLLKASPRIKNGNFDDLARGLASRMTDANVVCVAVAANCIEALALGLRTDFAKYKSIVTSPLLERLKEKKPSVLDALSSALDATFLSVTIGDITEDIVLFGKHKNPSVKEQTFSWLARSLKITTTAPSQSDISALLDVLIPALADSGEPIRVAAADGLGTLMKVVGERALGGKVDDLDDLRKAKVLEAFEKAEIKYKARGAAPVKSAPVVTASAKPKPKPTPTASIPSSPSVGAPPSTLRAVPPKAAPPARLAIKKPPLASTSSAPPPAKKVPISVSNASASKPSSSKPAEPLRYKYTQEDAEFQCESVFPPQITAGLSDSNWKARLEAIESLDTWLRAGELANVESELVVRYLTKKPGWKESNFQVAGKMFGVLQLLAEESPSFAKSSSALTIAPLTDKLGDIKLKKPATDALMTYAEKSSLQFVLSQAYEPMTKQKAPKAQADGLSWIEQALRDFGIVGVSVRDLIEFLKVGLKSTNAAVRTSATKALVMLKICVGADITTFLQDLNPALLTTIESEFAKVAADAPPEPTRASVDTAVESSSSTGKGKADEGDALDELFPRVDLDRLLSSASIAACNDANWKTRKEALEAIQSILETNKRLKPSNLSDLTASLKSRLADSNKIVQGLALDIVARIATGMGKPFDKHARIFAGPVAAVLADQKANIRAAGISTLTAIADSSGLDGLVSGFDKPLEAQNPILRKELLAWLEVRSADSEALVGVSVTPVVGAIISCLEDRNTDVRKSATALLPALISRAGYNYVIDETSKLKPASRSTVIPLIEAARSSAPISTSSDVPITAKASAPPVSSRPVVRTGLKSLRPLPAAAPSSIPSVEEPSRLAPPRLRPSIGGVIKPKPSSTTVSSARSTPVSSSIKEPLLRSADEQPKLIRQSKDIGALKWMVEGLPRNDQIEALYQQMTPHVSADLLGQLFSKDHNADKDFVVALSALDDCAKDSTIAEAIYDISPEEMNARLVANVDIIFKYITLRIGLPSTTITVKCLDLIDHLIPILAGEGHRLSDYEVNALLISLIAKVGDGKETIRQRVRTIFKSICSLYPFSKVFSSILDNGLVSKNSRTRAESAEELGSLFQRHGGSLFPMAKALPLIARLISDRDASVRTAALATIGAVYTLVGAEVVYKHIGTIPDKERTMLEERLKRTQGGGATASPARSSTPASRTMTPSRLDKLPVSTKPVPVGISRLPGFKRSIPAASSTVNDSLPEPALRPTPSKVNGIPRPSPPRTAALQVNESVPDTLVSTSPISLDRLITSVVTNDLSLCVDKLKLVQAEIISRPNALIPEADHLIESISTQMKVAFEGLGRDTDIAVLRLCKHLMQTLSAFFDRKSLGQAVSAEALVELLSELTRQLLSSAENPASEEISSLSKVLNMVLIRIFHSSDQSAVIGALFSILRDATSDLRELDGQELADKAKYAELVMKCLWKVSKTIKESLEKRTLSPSRLLRDIDDFLIATSPAEWRRRHIDNIPLTDMPLRTVKTILQQIVSVYGESVFDQLHEVEEPENSFVLQYLVRLSSQAAEPEANKIPSSATASLPAAPVVTSPAVAALEPSAAKITKEASTEGSADIEMNQRLKVIFDLIGDPINSRLGIAQLYEYQKTHPESQARIASWMSQTGNYFQNYLKRALDNLATADKERDGVTQPLRPSENRPISIAARSETFGNAPASPRTPRSTRISPNPNSPVPAPAKLEDLQSLFGFKDAKSGTM